MDIKRIKSVLPTGWGGSGTPAPEPARFEDQDDVPSDQRPSWDETVVESAILGNVTRYHPILVSTDELRQVLGNKAAFEQGLRNLEDQGLVRVAGDLVGVGRNLHIQHSPRG